MTLVEPANYIHTFSQTEQNRLIHQSKFLESYIYKTLDFSGSTNVLDIGCGVGAQIPIILQHHPHLKVTGLDNSQSQLERAHIFLKPLIDSSKVIPNKVVLTICHLMMVVLIQFVYSLYWSILKNPLL